MIDWKTSDTVPQDGTAILLCTKDKIMFVGYAEEEPVGGEMCSDGTGSPPDGYQSIFVFNGDATAYIPAENITHWAPINYPGK